MSFELAVKSDHQAALCKKMASRALNKKLFTLNNSAARGWDLTFINDGDEDKQFSIRMTVFIK